MTTRSNAGSRGGRKRRIMRALKINEISGVDVPAQEGAVAVIMKRDDRPAQTAHIEKGSALTTENDGHTHLVVLNGPPDGVELSSGETTWQDAHAHPWVRDGSGRVVIGSAHRADAGVPHTHDVAVTSKVAPEDDRSDPQEETMADDTKKTDAKIEELQAQLMRANSIASFNDAEKAHLATLKGPDADAFLAKSADDRVIVLEDVAKRAADAAAKAEGDDPVEYTTTDGIELRKSAGVAFIAMAKSNDALRKRLDESEDARDRAVLEKRAEADLAHIPGDLATRIEMLKAIDGIEDETKRGAALNALKAQNEAMGKAFVTIGNGGSPVPGSASEQLDTLAKAHQEKHPDMTSEQAYAAVVETEAGQTLYAKSVN